MCGVVPRGPATTLVKVRESTMPERRPSRMGASPPSAANPSHPVFSRHRRDEKHGHLNVAAGVHAAGLEDCQRRYSSGMYNMTYSIGLAGPRL